MSTEFEAQILDISASDVRERLLKLQGERVHKMFKMKRAVYDSCGDSKKSYVRVRQEHDGVTMTVKVYDNPDFPTEYEIDLKSDFEVGKKFLDSLQLKPRAYQETYREKWSLPVPGVNEITIDLWPGLPPYMEVDCDNEETLKAVIAQLDMSDHTIGYGPSANKYFHYYGIDPNTINKSTPVLTFKEIENQIHPLKNVELFQQISKKYHNC